MKSLLPLLGILTLAWVLIFLGAVIIFDVVVPMPEVMLGRWDPVSRAIMQALAATLLVLVWIYIMIVVRDGYIRRWLS